MKHWWEHAVIYQVYVRSFADSDGDGVGDLDGLRRRLDHIAGLGADAIWLTPVYPSPQRDHGYDITDYFDIDAAYGNLDSFQRLVGDAHRLGLRVLMDIVPNHCSDEHAWFREALAAGPRASERARFYFRDGVAPGAPPNNWQAVFGGSAWTPVGGDDPQWYLGTYTPHQPDLDHDHPDVDAMFSDALRFWFDRGVDGFRVDAVSAVGKAPDLPDAPPNTGVRDNPYTRFRPEGHAVWRRWRRTLEVYMADHPGRDLMLVAEAYAPRRPDRMADYVRPDEFHQVFAFDLLLSPWHGPSMRRALADSYDHVAPHGRLPTTALNNHDTERIVTRLGRDGATSPDAWSGDNLRPGGGAPDLVTGIRRARAAAGLLLALPGAVYLYQGEELGLPEVVDLPDTARQDPLYVGTAGRQRGRDGCRVPLPWTINDAGWHGFAGSHAADATPWLPQPAGWGAYAVEAQDGQEGSMFELYRRLIAARRDLPPVEPTAPIVDGDPGHDDLVVVRRGAVVVACNPGRVPRDVPAARDLTPTLSTGSWPEGCTVPPDTTAWFAPPR